MKILFLLPPSEGKNKWWEFKEEKISFSFTRPCELAMNVDEKDLKCKWERFLEWLNLNKNICNWKTNEYLHAIDRYSWVMFNAIDYVWMKEYWKKFFEENFLILSWFYWIVRPLDKIANYKLPIDTKWLFDFWWETIANNIVELKPDYIVNLLPINYSKLLWLAKCRRHIHKRKILLDEGIKIININFLKEDGKKISHWVKKIKWEWIKNICENNLTDIDQFWWEVVNNWDIIDINIKK
jgi:cytoplasmic iron level regulating protein YaaA (DUF328/UPF0246 family)